MASSKVTRAASLLLGIGLLVLVVWAVNVLFLEDRSMVIRRLDNDAIRLASTLFFDKMTAIAQLTVGLLGAAWAFVTLADTKVELKSRDAVVCFVVANASFALSLVVYSLGYDFIVSRVFHHSTFDVDSPFVAHVSLVQLLAFVWGSVSLALTILFGRQP